MEAARRYGNRQQQQLATGCIVNSSYACNVCTYHSRSNTINQTTFELSDSDKLSKRELEKKIYFMRDPISDSTVDMATAYNIDDYWNTQIPFVFIAFLYLSISLYLFRQQVAAGFWILGEPPAHILLEIIIHSMLYIYIGHAVHKFNRNCWEAHIKKRKPAIRKECHRISTLPTWFVSHWRCKSTRNAVLCTHKCNTPKSW